MDQLGEKFLRNFAKDMQVETLTLGGEAGGLLGNPRSSSSSLVSPRALRLTAAANSACKQMEKELLIFVKFYFYHVSSIMFIKHRVDHWVPVERSWIQFLETYLKGMM